MIAGLLVRLITYRYGPVTVATGRLLTLAIMITMFSRLVDSLVTVDVIVGLSGEAPSLGPLAVIRVQTLRVGNCYRPLIWTVGSWLLLVTWQMADWLTRRMFRIRCVSSRARTEEVLPRTTRISRTTCCPRT